MFVCIRKCYIKVANINTKGETEHSYRMVKEGTKIGEILDESSKVHFKELKKAKAGPSPKTDFK